MVYLKTGGLKHFIDSYHRVWSKVSWILTKTYPMSKRTSGKWSLFWKDNCPRKLDVNICLVDTEYLQVLLRAFHTLVGKAGFFLVLLYIFIQSSRVLFFQNLYGEFHFQDSLEADCFKIHQSCKPLWRRRNITTGAWNPFWLICQVLLIGLQSAT